MRTRWIAPSAAAVGVISILSHGMSAAQTPEKPGIEQTPQSPVIIRVGDRCWTRAEKQQGVVKVDACGRWYCGRADVKDIVEVRPNIAEVLNCTWRLEGDRCRCRRDTAGTTGR
jgi:hypothetical protein